MLMNSTQLKSKPVTKRTPIDKIHSIKNTKFNIVLYINESLRAKNMSLYGYERDTDITLFTKVLDLIFILANHYPYLQDPDYINICSHIYYTKVNVEESINAYMTILSQ